MQFDILLNHMMLISHLKMKHQQHFADCTISNIDLHNMKLSLVESQKGVIAAQRCFVENQKGAIAIHFVQQ